MDAPGSSDGVSEGLAVRTEWTELLDEGLDNERWGENVMGVVSEDTDIHRWDVTNNGWSVRECIICNPGPGYTTTAQLGKLCIRGPLLIFAGHVHCKECL